MVMNWTFFHLEQKIKIVSYYLILTFKKIIFVSKLVYEHQVELTSMKAGQKDSIKTTLNTVISHLSVASILL